VNDEVAVALRSKRATERAQHRRGDLWIDLPGPVAVDDELDEEHEVADEGGRRLTCGGDLAVGRLLLVYSSWSDAVMGAFYIFAIIMNG
jgi:hypothetical protein